MAHVRRRRLPSGKVRWQARTSTGSRETRSQVARDFERKGDAETWARDQGALIEQKGVTGGRASVAAFVERWLAFLRQRGELQTKTVAEYDSHLRRLLAIIGRTRLDQLTAFHLDETYSRLLERGGVHGGPLSPRTVLHCHRIIHTALARAVRWRLIPTNPASEAEAPSPGRSPARAPSAAELQAYLEVAEKTRWWPLILLCTVSGLRRGELCALRWGDIDFEARTLTVAQTAWEANGEYGIKAKAKTAASLRTLALPDFMIEELVSHRVRQAELRLACGKYYRGDLDLIFAQAGGELYPPSELTRQVSAIARASGLPRDCAPLHTLRHAHASAMLAEGVALKVAASRLGHSTVRITADLYQHTTRELDKAAAQAAERAVLPLIRRTRTEHEK